MNNPFNVTKLIRTDPFYHEPMEGDVWYDARLSISAFLSPDAHSSGGLSPKKLTFGRKAASLVVTWIGANATTFTTDTLRKCGTV
jgi:hypothetical protein